MCNAECIGSCNRDDNQRTCKLVSQLLQLGLLFGLAIKQCNLYSKIFTTNTCIWNKQTSIPNQYMAIEMPKVTVFM